MIKNFSTINKEKRSYQTPEMIVYTLDANATLLTTSNSISGQNAASDLYYGGIGDDEYGD